MWRWKALGYVAAVILFGVIFVKGCYDSRAAVFGCLIVLIAFVWIAAYISDNEHGR